MKAQKRICCLCKKPMCSSNHSIWMDKINYDIHKKCKDKLKEKKNDRNVKNNK